MTIKEWLNKVLWLTTVPTTYAVGGHGQPSTDANKSDLIARYKNNQSTKRVNAIRNTPKGYFFCDCCGSVKMLLDGFSADSNARYGGAEYQSVIKDVTIKAMMHTYCDGVSTDFSDIKSGEFVCNESFGHCGVFIGIGRIENGQYVEDENGTYIYAESVPSGEDGFQLMAREDYWFEHGKFKMVEYEVMTLKDYLNEKVKAQKGDKGEYVREIQNALIKKGFSCGATGADGSFGKNTLNAVFEFQNALKRIGVPIEPTGIVDYETMKWLIAF